MIGMELGFSGEVADLYHRYRHGYPAAVIDALAGAFTLTGQVRAILAPHDRFPEHVHVAILAGQVR